MTSGKRARALRQAETQRRSEALKALEGRRRRAQIWGAVAGIVVLAGAGTGIGILVSHSGSASGSGSGGIPVLKLASLASLGMLQPAGSPGSTGPEGIPIPNGPLLADTSLGAAGQAVDGIECQTNEQTLFHIHAHLTIFVDGSPRQIPAGIGIPGA
ncbi:MAG: hypothetical protein ACYDB3_11110, partial [Acidimicrobiales bacterium]